MQNLSKQIKRNCILFMMGILMVSCAKFDHKISTRVKGTVKYADGSPASGVYVKLVQVFKTYEETGSTAEKYNFALIVETNSEGGYDFKFKDDPRPEGYPKNFSEYFICISREFTDNHDFGALSSTTEVEFFRTIDHKTGKDKNKIKTGRKNRIDAIIKN